MPGTITELDLYENKEKTKKWYKLSEHVKDNQGMSEEDIIIQTENLTKQAISSNLISDVPIGLNVSGGVDSSMLVSMTMEELGHCNLFT